MGYYTQTTHCDFEIPKANLEAAYKALCDLNNRNDLKTGGSYPRPTDVDANKPHPYIWFSWMNWNYPETCKDTQQILTDLGFETELNENSLSIISYENKSGAEEIFFAELAPYANEGSTIEWEGEDCYRYKWLIENAQLIVFDGETTWVNSRYIKRSSL